MYERDFCPDEMQDSITYSIKSALSCKPSSMYKMLSISVGPVSYTHLDVYKRQGYDCIESLRKKYVEELKAGTWTFKGFGDYEDNWLTENIEGVANPEYPMVGEKIHGNKTAAKLSNVINDATNLCLGAKVFDCSGFTNDSENASMLIDGKLGTKWCATSSNVTKGEYKLNGVKHWIQIDLGSEKEFNTYTPVSYTHLWWHL